MRVAIMQPYFLPYIGYWQLIAAVDVFVVYDKIKYTKKGWINRNRFLLNREARVFSLPLRQGVDSLDIVEREIDPAFRSRDLLNQMRGAYAKAPWKDDVLDLLERILHFTDLNLFRFLLNSIREVCAHLGIQTELRVSTTIPIPSDLSAQARVLALCNALGASTYINPIGGTSLYSREMFRQIGCDLCFLRSKLHPYPQLGGAFVEALSILDVLMFNPVGRVKGMLMQDFEIL